jgi:hypothetical protein
VPGRPGTVPKDGPSYSPEAGAVSQPDEMFMKDLQQNSLAQLARRAAMLKEAAGALPLGSDRDLLLREVSDIEGRLRTAATGSVDRFEDAAE